MKKFVCFIFVIIFMCFISSFSFAGEIDIAEDELITKEEEIIIPEKEPAIPEEVKVAASDIEYADVPEVLYINQEFELNARVLPVDSTDMIFYESSDQNICKVNSMGQIKGIKKGNAVITIKAGNIKKNINIKVDIKSVLIETNKSCVILKPGGEFHIESKVKPSDAKQYINYKTLDSNVCEVDSKGNIKAKNYGTTSVVLSNEDTSASVTVIVNNVIQNGESEVKPDITVGNNGEDDSKNKVVKISECDIITKDVLKDMYENNKKLIVEGENYTITIDGKNIVNYNNEFNTDIKLKCDEGKIS
ncbi:MAG: hypothetical protein K6G26_03915, partial [Lachnospiraceae bacterium]|nr:hypothetical protein [Lachnospiraceae bacterium]